MKLGQRSDPTEQAGRGFQRAGEWNPARGRKECTAGICGSGGEEVSVLASGF